MKYVRFDDAEVESSSEGWRRAGLMSCAAVSVDWFERPPGHKSRRHSHESEQVFVVLTGSLELHTEQESVTLHPLDTAWVDAWEEHWSENPPSRQRD